MSPSPEAINDSTRVAKRVEEEACGRNRSWSMRTEIVLDLAKAPSHLNHALLIPVLRKLEEKARAADELDDMANNDDSLSTDLNSPVLAQVHNTNVREYKDDTRKIVKFISAPGQLVHCPFNPEHVVKCFKVEDHFRKCSKGIDIPDASCVVSYGAPASVNQLYQQLGRAARSPEVTGLYLLYYSKAEKQNATEEVAAILNDTECLRKVLLQHLGQDLTEQQEQCCCRCGEALKESYLLTTPVPARKARKKPRKPGERTGDKDSLRQHLKTTRDGEFRRQRHL
ncbi:3'-flap-structured DNA binding [Branchiostoma belcheri]|nr:3'-flap-structured DNA binding [Branchiostoma belcheri]